jgi:hypothetical protein
VPRPSCSTTSCSPGQIANAPSPKDYIIVGESLRTENQSLMLRKDDPEVQGAGGPRGRRHDEVRRDGPPLQQVVHLAHSTPKNININYPLNAETKRGFQANPSSKGHLSLPRFAS